LNRCALLRTRHSSLHQLRLTHPGHRLIASKVQLIDIVLTFSLSLGLIPAQPLSSRFKLHGGNLWTYVPTCRIGKTPAQVRPCLPVLRGYARVNFKCLIA
jgi:hypothetical protein